MYATAKAAEAANCPAWNSVCQFLVPMRGATSGTTTVSPGRRVAPKGSPLQKPELFLEARTEPSALMTKTAFLLANCVKPPAWLRYHLALLPGLKLTAVGLNTCP